MLFMCPCDVGFLISFPGEETEAQRGLTSPHSLSPPRRLWIHLTGGLLAPTFWPPGYQRGSVSDRQLPVLFLVVTLSLSNR